MRNQFRWLALAVLSWPALAAERRFNFGEFPLNQCPPGFRSTLSGEGKPGDWKIILDEVPPALPALTPNAPAVTKRAVLAQLAKDKTDEHFPLLIFDEETYGDFTLTTRFKTVDGLTEQMAGIAFRIQDERNYYVVRASSLGHTFRFYKVVNGERGTLVGPEMEIPKDVWHELTVECKGNQIRCSLDGKELISVSTDDYSFRRGKIGFWTKSDSVSYFADTKLIYTPREIFAQVLVRDVLKKYPRLLALKIYSMSGSQPSLRLIAGNDEKQVGEPGEKAEHDVFSQGVIYYAKGKNSVSVILPLRDRNGETAAAVRVVMRTFPGQTEQNAIVRAMPVVKMMQERIRSAKDLTE